MGRPKRPHTRANRKNPGRHRAGRGKVTLQVSPEAMAAMMAAHQAGKAGISYPKAKELAFKAAKQAGNKAWIARLVENGRVKDVNVLLGRASDKFDVVQQLKRMGEGGEIISIKEVEPKSLVYCPKCGSGVWDHATQDQRLNKCWGCGLRFEQANLPDGVRARSVPQAHLSSECWSVQMWGPEYCKTCEYRGTKECGGKRIRKLGKNEKGHKVPIGTEISNLEQFKDEEYLTAAQKTKLLKRFKMFLNALANPSDTDYDAETGSCPANVYRAFSNDLYDHSHLHIGDSAHYNKAGYCGSYFNSYEGIEEYMERLGKYSRDYDMYGDINNAMYRLWLPLKQKIRWAWMNKK